MSPIAVRMRPATVLAVPEIQQRVAAQRDGQAGGSIHAEPWPVVGGRDV